MKLSNAIKLSLYISVLGIAALNLVPMSGNAATATTTFAVTATVGATCIISATPLAFGSYTGVVDAVSSTLTVTCTNTTLYNVGLSAGLAPLATTTTRGMVGPGLAVLSYGMFIDAGHSVNFGQTLLANTVSGIGNGAAQPITVFGQIPASEFVAPGDYADTITATVTF